MLLKVTNLLVLSLPLFAAPKYQASDLELALNYGAKEMCSCIFISKRTEAVCGKYATIPSAPQPKLVVDREKRVVTASLAGSTSSASFISSRYGCSLED